jgi:gluconate 2-dehydrogenase gamma chain
LPASARLCPPRRIDGVYRPYFGLFSFQETNNAAREIAAGEDAMSDETIARRKFLLGAGLAGTAVATGLTDAPASAQTPAPDLAAIAANAAADATDARPRLLLNETEHAFVVAAVDTMIPADELSPSGSECGVAVFIDRQLASAWGGGAKLYRAGPFFKGKPEQGYQLPLTPAEFITTGIAAANAWSRKTYGSDFDQLDAGKRVEALKAMEEGKAELENINSRAFFGRLYALTMEGFFSDPIYGGNRNMASWRMLGFPGLPAKYAGLVEEYRDKRYVAEPHSIADFS